MLALPFAAWIYVIRRAIEAGPANRLLNPRRWIKALVLLAAVLYLLAPGMVGRQLSRVFEWYGSVFFVSLVLFIGIALLVVRSRKHGWTSLSQALTKNSKDSKGEEYQEPVPGVE